jgi:hypothetical protein
MRDEIRDHMDGFSSAEEAWPSSITETLRTWRYVMHETYEVRKKPKTTSSFEAAGSPRKDTGPMFTLGSSELADASR